MLYVSFVEIFVKSNEAFLADGREEMNAYVCATVSFFAGMVLLRLIALLVHKIDGGHSHCADPDTPVIRVDDEGQPDVKADQAAADTGAVSTKDSKLHRMGVNTAAAISIHNFPEGLATFVATLVDPAVGATLAVAIPIYYSTGSRLKGFLWALFSGISEPIGAFVGWALIKATGEDMNQVVYGILFGVVAGMMVMIVLLELLPTGYRYDPSDKVVTNSMMIGMFVMAVSLCLFLF